VLNGHVLGVQMVKRSAFGVPLNLRPFWASRAHRQANSTDHPLHLKATHRRNV